MGYYGMVVPAFSGHLYPMSVLAQALQQRGNRVVIVAPPDAEAKVRAAGIEFQPIASREFPVGEWDRLTSRMGELAGYRASLFVGKWLGCLTQGIQGDLPQMLARERFDGIVMDQIALGTEGVCAACRVPLAVACAALPVHFELAFPPITAFWTHRAGWHFKVRNLAGHVASNLTGFPVARRLTSFRLKHRLAPPRFDHINVLPPSLVQVVQQPACFDFSGRRLPDHFHYTGPWKEPGRREAVSFPWERLNGRPIIYASMGTLQNRLQSVFGVIAEACATLDAQLVLALGKKGARPETPLAGDPVVVDYAPQLELLARANLVITHGGLNTVLESLSHGLPLIALPITNDQPGVAARIEHLGLGCGLPLKALTAAGLRDKVQTVLQTASFRENAARCAKQIAAAGNHHRAAELIERAFTTRTQVCRE